MDKPQIFIAVNGNEKIGYGHVARTLVLATFFRNLGHKVVFLVPNDFLFFDRLNSHSHTFHNIGVFDNKEFISSLLIDCGKKKILIIDCVENDFNKLSFLSGHKNLFLVSITLFLFDLEEHHRYESLSFFPELAEDSARIISYKSHSLKIYTGKSYFIFRNEFKTLNKRISKIGKSILITMGGTDPSKLTLKILKSIEEFGDKDITVILSKSSKSYNEVNQICRENNLTLHQYVNNISELMKSVDILVINGGTTRYEACLTFTPFIAISMDEKQFNITKKLTDYVGAINLGVAEELKGRKINDSISELLSDFLQRTIISSKMKKVFDTNGAHRISQTILEQSDLYWSGYEHQ